jgi:hypothetical protein
MPSVHAPVHARGEIERARMSRNGALGDLVHPANDKHFANLFPRFRSTILAVEVHARRRASTGSQTRTSNTQRRMLEVLTIVRDDGSELAIHAMRMRPRYQPLLPEG